MADIKSLADKQQFWKVLFEEKRIAPQLITLATEHGKDGVTYELQQYGKVHLVVQAASALGDNFMSDTFIAKARVQGHNASDNSSKTLSTFIKILPSNVLLRQAAYESRVHHKEILAYGYFFDVLRNLSAQHSVPLDVPNVYYVHLEEIVKDETDGSGTCILLENLKEEGYCMSDKTCGADYNHCRVSLTSLAHYHALTHAVLKSWTDPSTGSTSKAPPEAQFIFEKTMYDVNIVEMLRDWSKPLLQFVLDMGRPDLEVWLAQLIERLAEVVFVDTLETSSPLACILHGDFWNNNMLFKYSEEDNKLSENAEMPSKPPIPIALKLIDFQIIRVGHPISDVLYYMYTSAAPETREQHMHDLMLHYYETLNSDLRSLGITVNNYTWQDFLADYKTRSTMWMFMGAMVMSMVLNKSVVKDLQDYKEEEVEHKESPKEEPETDVKANNDGAGISKELEDKMKNMMLGYKLSDNDNLSRRLLKLIAEVKNLTDS